MNSNKTTAGIPSSGTTTEYHTLTSPGWKRDVIAGICLTVLALVAAVRRPLFHDEASTWYFCGSTLAHLHSSLRGDVHPPLYFILAWSYFKCAGPNILGLRIVSCVLMGTAVFVFLRSTRLLFPDTEAAQALGWYCATSPFLAFAAYFARYYSLACLISAGCVWMLAKTMQWPSGKNVTFLTILTALLLLCNYASGAIFFPIAVAALWKSHKDPRERGTGYRFTVLTFALGVPVLFALIWGRDLFEQLQNQTPLVVPTFRSFSMTLASEFSYLLFCFGQGDGLPPWAYGGLVAFSLTLALLVRGVYASLSGSFSTRAVALLALIAIVLACVIGTVLLPGDRLLFLPPRIAPVFFAFALLVAGLPAAAGNWHGFSVFAARSLNAAGLVCLLIFNGTTNWSYDIPLAAISTAVKKEVAGEGREKEAAFWLPVKSFANVRFTIEHNLPDLALNSTTSETRRLIMLSDTRHPQWPPSKSVDTPESSDPPGDWKLVSETKFVRESGSASQMKAMVVKREVEPYKLSLRVYKRQPAPGP